ncbi:hypothetical protein DUNSADRAFT_15897 [Dunaliella salina]|uniref:C2H2-type domain-containing protein n=1 Tax=Dunaliella salina TaxID=3046 RepID=A0ABQ7G4N0_DUNSA|nr:hypothetical protein DUNSADRAFT_15897 [Dunaliella salina]|eukprot:KAF5829557.1 hypothetical protein DUNSADRAFT_15897 [Dunaliella salina]
MQDILSPITARASNFAHAYDGEGQPEPAVMGNSFPAIPMCRVLALLVALPGCSKALDLLAESCSTRFMLLSLQLGEHTGLYLHNSLSHGGGRVFDKFMEGMKAVPVPARGAVLETFPGLEKLGPVIGGGASCASDTWTRVISSPFAVGLTLFNDALTQIWYDANKAPVPSSTEAPLSTEVGSTLARQKIHRALTNASYRARSVKSLKSLFDLGPAHPFCPIACANASCDRLGEVLKPHPHPTGVGSNWEAPPQREWFWNFSNDATRQTFYFHCDECWKEFRARSLDLHAALHCTGWL